MKSSQNPSLDDTYFLEPEDEPSTLSDEFKFLRTHMPRSFTDEQLLDQLRQNKAEKAEDMKAKVSNIATTFEQVFALDPERVMAEIVVKVFVAGLWRHYPSLAKVQTISASREGGKVRVTTKGVKSVKYFDTTYAKHVGEYEENYENQRLPELNGTYRLIVAPGRNEGETVYLRLQQPNGQVLCYPAADKANVVDTPELRETTSISMMHELSGLRATPSLHMFFGIGHETNQPVNPTSGAKPALKAKKVEKAVSASTAP
ncbi:MAG: hypothetical protein AB7N76_05285 [Planctomycetota bacterium]